MTEERFDYRASPYVAGDINSDCQTAAEAAVVGDVNVDDVPEVASESVVVADDMDWFYEATA